MAEAQKVAETHDRVCKVHFGGGSIPQETDRQRDCIKFYEQLATILTGRNVNCRRASGSGFAATWGDGSLTLNIDVKEIWEEPVSEYSIGLIIHECSHNKVSGHNEDFMREVQRLGAKLALWIGQNHDEWIAMTQLVA